MKRESRPGRPMATSPRAPYAQAVEAYDIVHQDKPYEAEARAIRSLARRFARRPVRSLLDVACGSGRHLEWFARWYRCAGVDASPAMLRRARARVSGVPLARAPMQRFRLARTFDVVTCLFSAIGYVRSEPALHRTLRTFAGHLSEGGVVFVEPWLPPEVFESGRIDALERHARGTVVLRMNSCSIRRGLSVMEFVYLVGRDGRIRRFEERHELGLFSDRTVASAFRAAGLAPRKVRTGPFAGRGLWVGVKGPSARRPAGRGPSGGGRSRRQPPAARGSSGAPEPRSRGRGSSPGRRTR